MNPTLRRLRGPFAVHLAGVLLTAAWYGPLVGVHPPADAEEVVVAQACWAVATAPYTVAALAWAARPGRAEVWHAARGVVMAGTLLVPAAALVVWHEARKLPADATVAVGAGLFAIQMFAAAVAVEQAVRSDAPPEAP